MSNVAQQSNELYVLYREQTDENRCQEHLRLRGISTVPGRGSGAASQDHGMSYQRPEVMQSWVDRQCCHWWISKSVQS